jgi:hypothetical protein
MNAASRWLAKRSPVAAQGTTAATGAARIGAEEGLRLTPGLVVPETATASATAWGLRIMVTGEVANTAPPL